MSQSAEPPVELRRLFRDFDPGCRTLPVPLPPGRAVAGDEGADEHPALWLSDGPAAPGLWPSLRSGHSECGLWPLLLDSYQRDARRPWDDGELWPEAMSSPAEHDPGELLAAWWASHTSTDDEDDQLSAAERIAVTAPYGQEWPGLAGAMRCRVDPDEHADHSAAEMLRDKPGLRLGLVAADRGSDALTVAGWQGAVNYVNDTAELSAVLRSWEDRFGARLIGVGFAELYLSVAALPSDRAEATRVAAEHFAFCPDNVWQAGRAHTLTAYAERLMNAPIWSFWWD
ncbi:DUF4253 domain-containing protein [Plantactinospora sp. WMMB782]|uniref:DUF4253 domain-containing protein n=1 Tax=Plantactinospora sp. WMMB782 TaxID=3404121 RepID=UPI003B92CAE8